MCVCVCVCNNLTNVLTYKLVNGSKLKPIDHF